ncbi:hypothetical protein BURKHO8Y_140081 [Burkholderia sp. 8Y]|nr:hypothetical protein BURKHO8Y_140081 [Burkholderia sp. 8Y]
MLALPGLVGCFSLLLVCVTCRQPGVRLFTVITLSNRKRTLTALGSTLYLVCWVFCVVVIALSLLYPSAFMHHAG